MRLIRSFTVLMISLFLFGVVHAQSLQITGEIRDSLTGYTLSGVTVAAYFKADSSLMDVQLTDNAGSYMLKVPASTGTMDIYVSFAGYHTFKQSLATDSAQSLIAMKTILLLRNYEKLEEVVLLMAPPVSMNGDTLEINPSAYRLGENAVVEDLLKKVNGVVVWGDGTITVNGRKVNHVYVDGKPFISDNARIATQNLPKDAIEKIQVYKEKGGDPLSLRSDSLLAMNIQLKEDRKNGILAKLNAGYGTSDRYDLGLTGILFTRQSRLALAAQANNINKRIAGMQTALENSTYKNTNPNLSDAPDFDMNGENTNQFYGGVFQHSFKPVKRLFLANDIRVELNRSQNKATLQSDIRQFSSINQDKQNIHSAASTQSRFNTTNAGIAYTKKSASTSFSITANLDDNHHLSEKNELISQKMNGVPGSENKSFSTDESQNKKIGLGAQYHNMDKKNLGLKSFDLALNISHNDAIQNQYRQNIFQSFVPGIPDRSLDRKYHIRNKVTRGDVSLSYPGLKRLLWGIREVPGLEMSLNNQWRLNNEQSAHGVEDAEPGTFMYKPNADLTYHDHTDSVQYKPAVLMRKSFGKYLYWRMERSFVVDINIQGNLLMLNNSSSIFRRNLNRSFAFFEPGVGVRYSHQNNNRLLEFGYKANLENKVPEIDQLFPVTDSINAYFIAMGNASLTTSHLLYNTLSFDYKSEKVNRKDNFSASFKTTYIYTRDAVADSMITDEAGRSLHFPVNVLYSKKWATDIEANYSIRLHRKLLQFQYNGSLNRITIPGFINGDMNISAYRFFNNHLKATCSFSDVLTAELVQSAFLNRFRLANTDGEVRSNNLFNTALNLNLIAVPNLIFSNSFNFLISPGQDESYLLWNTYLTWRFSANEKYELKFSAFDILKNYRNIKTELGYNFNTTINNASLQRFFMISFGYYLRKI